MDSPIDAVEAAAITLRDYDRAADEYQAITQAQDLGADYDWFLSFLEGTGPFDLLDLGCGPGRDLMQLRRRGHRVVGLDGSAAMVALARKQAGDPVLHQNLLALRIGSARFDGIFASASLFHVPPASLPQVLTRLHRALRSQGILYTLNPRGRGQSGWAGDRYCTYHSLAAWRRMVKEAGFREQGCAGRPAGAERARQRWVAWIGKKAQ
jgi:SAM-dependent methyltransferase